MNKYAKPPLCVDLDGTLLHSDILLESVLALLKQRPWFLALLPFWLLQGRAYLKAQIASRVELEVETLPYNRDFLNYLNKEHEDGRILVLATASHFKFANQIAAYLGIFSAVYATQDRINLAADAKKNMLVEHYGEHGFDYAGNSRADIKVWQAARAAIVVNPDYGVLRAAQNKCQVDEYFKKKPTNLKTYLKALRVHQWIKNVLVFIPLVLAHKIKNFGLWFDAGLAFLSFSLCASGVYILNDILDLSSDRQHPRKCKRPFAAGDLSILSGLLLCPLLCLAAFLIAGVCLPSLFSLVLAIYLSLTILYSFYLKKLVLLDTLVLAVLYTIRIVGGMATNNIDASFWLLVFSIFIFFSLALVKRYSELLVLEQQGKQVAHGRGYHVEDIVMLLVFGVASGFSAALVSALYINSVNISSLYKRPEFLWIIPPVLLYWVSRIWMIAHRGKMHDDPIVFSAKDPVSWFTAFIVLVFLALAAL